MSQHFRRAVIDCSLAIGGEQPQTKQLSGDCRQKLRADYRLAAADSEEATAANKRDICAKNVRNGHRKSGPIDKDSLIITMQMATR